MNFTAMDFAATDAWRNGGKASNVVQRSKFMRSKGALGKENSLIMLKAELFPNRAHMSHPEAHKGPAFISDGLKAADRWLMNRNAQ